MWLVHKLKPLIVWSRVDLGLTNAHEKEISCSQTRVICYKEVAESNTEPRTESLCSRESVRLVTQMATRMNFYSWPKGRNGSNMTLKEIAHAQDSPLDMANVHKITQNCLCLIN